MAFNWKKDKEIYRVFRIASSPIRDSADHAINLLIFGLQRLETQCFSLTGIFLRFSFEFFFQRLDVDITTFSSSNLVLCTGAIHSFAKEFIHLLFNKVILFNCV